MNQPPPPEKAPRYRNLPRKYLLWVAAFIAYVGIGFFAVGQNLLNSEAKVVDSVGLVLPDEIGHDKDSVQIWYQAISFEPETQKAQFAVYPWPSDEMSIAFSSSTISKDEFDLFLDQMYGNGIYSYKEGSVAGAIQATFDVLSFYGKSRPHDALYPFDTYVLDTYAKVSEPEVEIDKPGRRAFEFFYLNTVEGFDVSYTRFAGWEHDQSKVMYDREPILEERERGEIAFLAEFKRTVAVKFSVLLLATVILLNAFSLIWTTIGVAARRRPPSMQALVWSAASVLGTIQMRDLFPGRPRLGIAFDYLVFFPSLLACMMVALILTLTWSRRSDFHI